MNKYLQVLFLIVVCRMYGTHELKMVGKIMRGIRVEWSGVEKKVDGIYRGKKVENKNCGIFFFHFIL